MKPDHAPGTFPSAEYGIFNRPGFTFPGFGSQEFQEKAFWVIVM